MNWEIVGSLGEILGAFAVVGSLVYVGRQFRHSSTQALHGLYAQAVANFSSSRENADLMHKGNVSPEDLTPSERYHYSIMLHDLLNAVSINWEQYKRGYINEEAKDRLMAVVAYYISSKGGQAFWNGELGESLDHASPKLFFPASYVSAIDNMTASMLQGKLTDAHTY